MPNIFFSFKQFTVYQDRCAMKVCTDACLLGAWAAAKIRQFNPIENILDIGCGTGLLSLMLAQQTAAGIDAIEIDPAAASQAVENVERSPWKKSIQVTNIALQELTGDKKYDFIICNPPFFEDDLKSADKIKNASRHGTALRFDELILFIKNNLTANGTAAVLIPYHRTEYFSVVLKKSGLFIHEILFVKQSPSHSCFRSIILLSGKNKQPVESNELSIHDHERNYTAAFRELLSAYYLKS